jgi:glycosyltransferase involved in cell wall biosynthesis
VSTPLVSVVIPCRNAASWLGQAIDSCLAQSWSRIEIIVVDNGSSDASPAIASSYADRGVTALECARPGASAARNEGLARAKGDFIQFLDADDLIDRDKVAVQLARLARAPARSIASAAWARFADDASKARLTPEPVWADLTGPDFLTSSWLGGGMMPSFAWLAPRAVIDAAGPWDETLSQLDDGEYFCRVALAAAGILFCGEARGYYRTGAATLSRRRDRAALESAFRSIERSCEALAAYCGLTQAVKEACATHWQRFIYDTYPLAPDLVARAEAHVASFGGSELEPAGGPAFRAISCCLGWKAARHCQSGWHAVRRARVNSRDVS